MDKAVLHLDKYKNSVLSKDFDLDNMDKEYKDFFYGKWNESGVKVISKEYDNSFYYEKWMSLSKGWNIRIHWDKIKTVNDYILLNGFKWDLIAKYDKYCVIKYGSTSLFVFEEFLDIYYEPKYDNMTPAMVKAMITGKTEDEVTTSLPTSMTGLTLDDVRIEETTTNSLLDQLKQEMEDVKNNKTNELAKIQKEIDEKMAVLKQKKESMMVELNKKKLEFEAKLNELKKQIFLLKTEIYSIRCFAGETIDLIKLRNGKSENIETPIVLNQKILYLDEDLARAVSIYGENISSNFKLLEEAIKYNDTVMEMFCPQPKSVSFFKLSRSGVHYNHNIDEDILEAYELLHAGKMGFVARNGENVYVGWLEEDWDHDPTDKATHKLKFDDSIIFRPEVKQLDPEDSDKKVEETNPDEVVSRYFAINVLQGLVEHKDILTVPEKVNVIKPSKYIVHNYADAWLEDNRYGNFSSLVSSLHEYNHIGDKILIITGLSESDARPYQASRSRGERNTTRDCYVESGLNRINLIENGNIFVSAKRNVWYGEAKNKANLQIDTSEFVNLTFMNSDWLKYYIDTKKIGAITYQEKYSSHSSTANYSYMIPFFKLAYEYLLEREYDEIQLISKYYEDIENVPDWRDKLSHWKILNGVRTITDYQAKRFAKYLVSGNLRRAKHLYDGKYVGPAKLRIETRYYQTNLSAFSRKNHWCTTNEDHPEYSWWGDNKEVADKPFQLETPDEEINERLVSDRIKLKYIIDDIRKYGIDNGVDIDNDKSFRKILIDNCNDSMEVEKYCPGFLKEICSNDLEKAICYETYKDKFNSSLRRGLYTCYRYNYDRDNLKELSYIFIIQAYFCNYLEECIHKVLRQRYISESEKY